jgi:hypothetical protein
MSTLVQSLTYTSSINNVYTNLVSDVYISYRSSVNDIYTIHEMVSKHVQSIFYTSSVNE